MPDDANPAHPPPWRWVEKKMGNWSDDDERAADRLVLVDANGDYIIDTDGDDYSWVTVESAAIRTVTELAPEMEVALKAAVDMVRWLAPFASAFAPPGSNLPTEIAVSDVVENGRALLRRIDAARKANP